MNGKDALSLAHRFPPSRTALTLVLKYVSSPFGYNTKKRFFQVVIAMERIMRLPSQSVFLSMVPVRALGAREKREVRRIGFCFSMSCEQLGEL